MWTRTAITIGIRTAGKTGNGWEYRTYRNDQRPDGWEQGRRSEWRNCEQYDCYSYQYQGQPYYYYRGDDGQLCVRRQHRDHDHGRDDRDRDRDRDHDRDQH